MNVIQAIIALLYDHDTVIVPALGAFVRHDESAQVNVITNEFQKPSSTIEFDPNQREENPLIIEYLMQHEDLGDEEARQQIAAFVADCYAKMREGETVTLEGLGTLYLNGLQEPEFEPEASTDFNPDAFGLTDLDVQPVYGVEPVETPTPNVIASSAEPNVIARSEAKPATSEAWWKQSNLNWLWILLLVFAAAAIALWYFKFRPIQPEPPVVQPPLDSITVTDTLKPLTNDTTEVVETSVDTALISIDSSELKPETPPVTVEEPQPPTETVKAQPESKAFIVGGCFSVEQNALNMAMEAYEQGCQEAFVMKRGSKFFVCYGQYPTTAEAKEALPEILQNYNQKAWILVK